MAIKKDKPTGRATIKQPTNRELTADAPEAPALAEINQSADGVEDKTDDTKALDQDKTPPIGGSAPESTAQGDKNPPAGDTGDKDGSEIALIAMRRRDVADGGPDTADVHPDEVESWRVHGWEIDPVADGFEIHDPNS